MKEFMITKNSVVEIQNLLMNPKSRPVKSNSEQYQFLFKYISGKINDKIFQNLPKGNFSQKFWLSTTVVVTQHLEVKITEKIIPSLSACKKSFHQSTQFIKLIEICLIQESHIIYRVLPIFDHAHSIIIKVTFSFSKFVSACKNSAHFINSFLTYSRF